MYEDAIAEYKKLAEQKVFSLYGEIGLASVYARLGWKVEARQLLAKIESKLKSGKAPSNTPYQLALIQVALGDKNEAFIWLDKALEAHGVYSHELRYSWKLDPLKDDPRFEQMLSRHEYTKALAPELSKRVAAAEVSSRN